MAKFNELVCKPSFAAKFLRNFLIVIYFYISYLNSNKELAVFNIIKYKYPHLYPLFLDSL